VIEVFGEDCLRPLGLDEAKDEISEFSFLDRGRELGRSEFVWEKWSLGHNSSPKEKGQHLLASDC
jgi:hypothetical protein